MKRMKRISALLLTAAMSLSLVACGGTSTTEETPKGSGEIYYLNFKPEIAEVYDEISAAYEAETGVKLNVITAASGTYEQTLKSEIAKAEAPTLFQINGPKGYASWKDYCADLSDTELYSHLTDKSLAVTDGEGVYGIPYVVEGYGIIYNNAIMDKYFATAGAKATSMDEINNFATLKAVAEDMSAKKDELGIKGVFASTSLKPGEDWRWQTHLANIPVYYEFKNNDVDLASDATKEIKFEYADNYKNIFDLYINNSTTERKLLGSKQVSDSMAEFALGQCAFVQNGNWAWSQISQVEGNVVAEQDIKFMPIYTGMEGEEEQGLCTGTENFFAVNSQASEEDQKLAEDFIYWLYSSETGKQFVIEKLNFIAPFDTFTDTEKPADPLAKEVIRWMEKEGTTSVAWNFTVFPSQAFKDNFGASLLQYAQGTMPWETVVTNVVTDWKAESGM
ncbi:MAG: ABC transporter substrate-binding protein [Proteocatella sp.]